MFAKYYKAVSHVVFKHLQPFIHRAIDLDISPVITIDETVLKDTNLLKLIRPVAIYLAVAYAIEDSGVNIDETGVWLENKVPADGSSRETRYRQGQAKTWSHATGNSPPGTWIISRKKFPGHRKTLTCTPG